MVARTRKSGEASLRIGEAAEMLGVSVETVRRWGTEGRLELVRTEGNQRRVSVESVHKLAEQRRRGGSEPPIVGQSARNRFAGVITRVEKDRVAAVVEDCGARVIFELAEGGVRGFDVFPGMIRSGEFDRVLLLGGEKDITVGHPLVAGKSRRRPVLPGG